MIENINLKRQGGDGGTQFMGGIADECALCLKGAAQPFQQRIKRPYDWRDFTGQTGFRHSIERLRMTPFHFLLKAPHRLKLAPYQPPYQPPISGAKASNGLRLRRAATPASFLRASSGWATWITRFKVGMV